MNLLQQALLFVAILFSLGLVGTIIYYLAPVLTPFIIAAVLAYLADPLVERLSRAKWRVPRTLSVIGVFLVVILLLLAAILFLIPALQQQLTVLVAKIPGVVNWVQQTVFPKLIALGLVSEDMGFENLKMELSKHFAQASQVAKWMWATLFHSGLAILGWLMNLIIVFVATFYLLRDWQSILTEIKELLPPKVAPIVIRLARRCDEVLATFVRGQLSVMVTLGIFYTLGLAIIGVNFYLLLGMMIGFLSIVPYLGSILGLGAALIVTYLQFHALLPIIFVSVLFSIGHILEGMVLTPLLIGDKLGLHPVVVIFAVLAGGHLLGFVGIVLALPLTAILVVLLRELLHKFQGSASPGVMHVK